MLPTQSTIAELSPVFVTTQPNKSTNKQQSTQPVRQTVKPQANTPKQGKQNTGGNRSMTDEMDGDTLRVDSRQRRSNNTVPNPSFQAVEEMGMRPTRVTDAPEVDENHFFSKYQNEIDSLKRTMNELVLRSQFNIPAYTFNQHSMQ